MNPRPAHERVLARVRKTDAGCWMFTGARNPGGYGIVQLGRGVGTDKAHRVVYRALVGEIPTDGTVDHLCANTACVNPAHLEIVSRAENARRQWADGRADPGRANRAKTHCPHGHAYEGDNLVIRGNRRHCRECGRIASRERQRKLRANVQEVRDQRDGSDAPVDSVAPAG